MTSIGGQATSEPSCTNLGVGKVLCAARSATGGITSTIHNGTIWSAFSNIVATTISPPSCASDSALGAICATRTINQNVLVYRHSGAAWSAAINVGGNATNDPNCAKTGVAGRVTYFARGTEMSLWRNQFNGGAWSAAGWSGWLSLGGFHRLTASCAMTTIG